MEQIYIGIDISKNQLDVHVLPTGNAFAVARDGGGITALAEQLRALAPTLIVMEATGGFETVVAAALGSAGLPLAVVNPRQIRDFARAANRFAKTDAIDAATIALFGARMQPEPRPLADEETRILSELVARRRQIVEMMTAERNRRSRMLAKRSIKSVERLLKALQKELSDLEADLDDTIRGTPIWRETEDLLTTVPGVGGTLARSLIADLPELGRLSRKQIAALVGVAPMNRESGTWRGKRFITAGRAKVRTVLYMAALSASRHNPILKSFYQRLIQTGKAPKLALTAVMRKLITILNAMMRDKNPWQNA